MAGADHSRGTAREPTVLNLLRNRLSPPRQWVEVLRPFGHAPEPPTSITQSRVPTAPELPSQVLAPRRSRTLLVVVALTVPAIIAIAVVALLLHRPPVIANNPPLRDPAPVVAPAPVPAPVAAPTPEPAKPAPLPAVTPPPSEPIAPPAAMAPPKPVEKPKPAPTPAHSNKPPPKPKPEEPENPDHL